MTSEDILCGTVTPYDIETRLDAVLDEAENKAMTALTRGNFQGFGHRAATWVILNKQGDPHSHNPFSELIRYAQIVKESKAKPMAG